MDRFLELGSIMASQAATISDLLRRIEDLESTAHVHAARFTSADLLERLNSIKLWNLRKHGKR